MRPCRGMGAVNPAKLKRIRKREEPVALYSKGGESRVNEAGNYTTPGMRKSLFNRIKGGGKGGAPGQWSARKAQMLAMQYKQKGGGYKD